LLTGMGKDGALGLLALRKARGLTVAQDEESCVVYGMPREAVLLGGAQHVLPLNQIGRFLAATLAARPAGP
jgi:two-component system chemotaxis response regulator CheB